MIEEYLLNREMLVCVILIVDFRRTPMEMDIDLRNWLETSGIDYMLVATKQDKVSKNERASLLRVLNETFLGERTGPVIAYSSKSNSGRLELWNAILKKIEEKKNAENLV